MTIRRLHNFRPERAYRIATGDSCEWVLHPRIVRCGGERNQSDLFGINEIFQRILSNFPLLIVCALLCSLACSQDKPSGRRNVGAKSPLTANHEASAEVSSETTSGQGHVASSSPSSTVSFEAASKGKQTGSVLPDGPGESSRIERAVRLQSSSLSDFNKEIYCRNKLEFSVDGGWFPINIPFPFNIFEGDPYELYPLRYTLVPIVASLRWHIDGIGSRWIFRGNWDMTAGFSATAIPRGAESHYLSYDMGVRRNFVPRNSKIAPYTDLRLGLGIIDAKGPLGVYYAQGQNYTFTANLGAGVRYNINSRYGISAGLNWMHISNNNLSSPEYSNYGINVYGPQFGLNVRLRRGRRMQSE
jgi:hypothetical protein